MRPKASETADDSAPASQAGGLEDGVLVRQIQAGQVHLYTELVRKYQDRIYNTCWRLCGDREDARDLTQDVFLKGLASIRGFRGKSGFYTWIFRIAVNMSISHRRRSVKRRTVSADDWSSGGDESQAGGLLRLVRDEVATDPSEAAMQRESHERVAKALADLDEDYRCVLVLRDLEGFDYQEIADILKLAVGTVKSRIHRGRLALRKAMTGKDAT